MKKGYWRIIWQARIYMIAANLGPKFISEHLGCYAQFIECDLH